MSIEVVQVTLNDKHADPVWVFYDDTKGWVFGPQMPSREAAELFSSWVELAYWHDAEVVLDDWGDFARDHLRQCSCDTYIISNGPEDTMCDGCQQLEEERGNA